MLTSTEQPEVHTTEIIGHRRELRQTRTDCTLFKAQIGRLRPKERHDHTA